MGGPLMHPKERRLDGTRRDFLLRSGGAALSLSSISGILAACSNSTTAGTAGTGAGGWPLGPGGIPLARPAHPVKIKRWGAPIAPGRKAETGGTVTLFHYPPRLHPA